MKENKFIIESIGYNTIHDNGISIDRKNGTNNHLFLYIKTPVNIFYNDEMHYISEPSFILYNKKSPQFYFYKEGAYVDDWLHFDGPDTENFFNKLKIPFDKPMIIQNAKEITQMISDLYKEYRQNGDFHEEIMDSKIKTMFYKFSDIYNTEINFSDKLNRYRRDFNDIRNKIYNFGSFDKDLSVNEIAASLNLSTSYFQHIYKKLFGVSLIHDIIESRIEYACHLLRNNFDSIGDIAYRCGYENKEHFTRQFKDVTGYTPKQYREK